MVPSTARYIISVAYYNSQTQSLLAESGKGFNINGWINPDITTAGKDILTMFPGDRVGRMSGEFSSNGNNCRGMCLIISMGNYKWK